MKGCLTSQYHKSQWNDLKVVSLKVNELWASVPKAAKLRNKTFYQMVFEDIEKNGLHFPLLVVDARRGDLVRQKKKYGNKICELPFDQRFDDLNARQYTVWGGSNRWHVANELKYEYVDCVIIPNADFDKARNLQGLHRKPYKGKLY